MKIIQIPQGKIMSNVKAEHPERINKKRDSSR
jgi:hypothetical protein